MSVSILNKFPVVWKVTPRFKPEPLYIEPIPSEKEFAMQKQREYRAKRKAAKEAQKNDIKLLCMRVLHK
jgi:hypothetical protein